MKHIFFICQYLYGIDIILGKRKGFYMNENIKLEAQVYIKNTCKCYKNYFYLKNTNIVMNRVVKILEKKFLNINTFCYYIINTLSEMNYDAKYYSGLTRLGRRQLAFYQDSFVKIYMHIDYIFNEIDEIKKYIKKF